MRNLDVKTTKSREVRIPKSVEIMHVISGEDISRRAYEMYLENDDTYLDELDKWFRAEKELRESDQ